VASIGGAMVIANFIVCMVWKCKNKSQMETELETETDKVEPHNAIEEEP
jgi:hypothetical protein